MLPRVKCHHHPAVECKPLKPPLWKENNPKQTFQRKHITVADSPDDFAAALATIRCASLPHPDVELLECFLHESVHPSRAAAYLLRRCPSGADASALAAFLSDWKRLVRICKYACQPNVSMNQRIYIESSYAWHSCEPSHRKNRHSQNRRA